MPDPYPPQTPISPSARLHGLNAMEFLRNLLTNPAAAATAILPAAASVR